MNTNNNLDNAADNNSETSTLEATATFLSMQINDSDIIVTDSNLANNQDEGTINVVESDEIREDFVETLTAEDVSGLAYDAGYLAPIVDSDTLQTFENIDQLRTKWMIQKILQLDAIEKNGTWLEDETIYSAEDITESALNPGRNFLSLLYSDELTMLYPPLAAMLVGVIAHNLEHTTNKNAALDCVMIAFDVLAALTESATAVIYTLPPKPVVVANFESCKDNDKFKLLRSTSDLGFTVVPLWESDMVTGCCTRYDSCPHGKSRQDILLEIDSIPAGLFKYGN
jgi:hypothetical protein